MLAGAVYVITLRGTAYLASTAKAWARSDDKEWRAQAPVPGLDLMVEVPRDVPEGPRGTRFELAIYPAHSFPGQGTPSWGRTYWIRNTPEGPVLDRYERAGAGSKRPARGASGRSEEDI
jgi:hypothetical protein